jgi:tetratricopeptide (TPR) repeat protein
MIFKAFASGDIEFDDKFQRFVPFLMGMNDKNNPLDSAALDKGFSVLIATHPFEPKGYVGYGNFLLANNDKSRAAENFAKSLELDAQQSDVWQDYLFMLSGMVDSVKMLEKSREALRFFPQNAIFHLFEGVSLYQQQMLEEALSAFKSGLEFVEDNKGLAVQFHAYIGDIYHSLGDTENSFSHYEQALAIDENNLIVLNNYSYYLSLRGERLEDAERMSAKTVELDPGNPTYLDTYAWVLFKRGRYLEAKFIIERAIDEEGEVSGVILEHYGDILFMTGDVNEAVKVWGKALEKEDHSDVLLKKIEEKRFIDGEK